MGNYLFNNQPMLRTIATLGFASLLATSATAAPDIAALARHRWIQVSTPHFTIITEQPEKVARRVATDLEELRHFRTTYGGAKPFQVVKPLTIVAIGNNDAFAQLGMHKHWAGVFTMNLEGYSALANITDYVSEDSKDAKDSWARMTLQHEYLHFLMRLTEQTVAYPMWIDEGTADFWASFNIDEEGVKLGERITIDGNYGVRTGGLLSFNGRPTIDTRKVFNTRSLPMRSEDRMHEEEIGRFYSSAYFAVHYFNSTPALRGALRQYLQMINLGYRQDRAAQLAFGKTYEQLNRDIIQYASRRQVVHTFAAKGDGLKFPKITPLVAPLDQPALYAHFARVLPNYLAADETRALLTRNRELNPDQADAHVLPLLHGEEAIQSTRLAELAKRFPNDARLVTLHANLLRRQATYMRDQDQPGWLETARQARLLYRKAIALDRDYGAAYDGLGRVYLLLPDSDTLQEGVAGFDTASVYTRDPETFRHLANTFLRMKQPMLALPALRGAVAFSDPEQLGPEALLLDNLELLEDLTSSARPADGGLLYETGTVYAGPVRGGKPDGHGRLTLRSGSYYEGDFADGVPHGKGKLASDHGLAYRGDFDQGMARGTGELTYPATSALVSYQGQVDHARPSGRGELVSKAGRYVGQFLAGAMHGSGEFTAANKAVTLHGKWREGGLDWPLEDGVLFRGPANADGLRDGAGLCRTADPHVLPGPCRFKNGKLARAAD